MNNSASLLYGKKLNDEITYVKQRLHGIGVQEKESVTRLGEAFVGVINQESICKEIKKVLEDGLVSSSDTVDDDDIDRLPRLKYA